MSIHKAAPIRRIAAFGADYIVLALYIAGLTAVIFAVNGGNVALPPATLSAKVAGHVLGFVTLTLPVVLYFTLFEASISGATLGKRLFGIRVVTVIGERTYFLRTLSRNMLKFLPWEAAHAAIWYVPGRPFLDAMPNTNLMISIAAIAVASLYVISMFFGGRTIYDRLAGTLVVKRMS